jgi:hypothetical protein
VDDAYLACCSLQHLRCLWSSVGSGAQKLYFVLNRVGLSPLVYCKKNV